MLYESHQGLSPTRLNGKGIRAIAQNACGASGAPGVRSGIYLYGGHQMNLKKSIGSSLTIAVAVALIISGGVFLSKWRLPV